MDLTFIGYAIGAISLVLMIFSVRQMRRESIASRTAPIYGMIFPAIMTLVFMFIADVPLNLSTAAVALGVGFIVGLVEGQFTRLYYRGNLLVLKRNGFYFVLWGLTYLLTLLLAQTEDATLTAGGIMAMILGSAIAVGSNLNLLLRQSTMRQKTP